MDKNQNSVRGGIVKTESKLFAVAGRIALDRWQIIWLLAPDFGKSKYVRRIGYRFHTMPDHDDQHDNLDQNRNDNDAPDDFYHNVFGFVVAGLEAYGSIRIGGLSGGKYVGSSVVVASSKLR